MDEREKNQKAWVKKNLHRGKPKTVSLNGKTTYGVLGREFGNPVFIWRSGIDGLGLVATSQEYAKNAQPQGRKENEMKQLTKSQARVSTSNFRFAHGKSPRGFDGWFFEFGTSTDYLMSGANIERAPSGTFTEAKKWAVNRAVQLGTPIVEVCS